MGIIKRLKRLEEQCATPSGKNQLIIRVRRFSEGPSDLPPVEEQIDRQRKEGKKIIVVRVSGNE
jgi:hypothetical protein